MAVEVQRCSDCGWSESGEENINPHRKQCPKCGAYYFEKIETQWFGGQEPGYCP